MSPVPALDKQKVTFTFVDGLENVSAISHYVPLGTAYTADLDPLYTALDAVSNCAMERVSLSFAGTDPTQQGAASAYDTVEDKMDLQFQASDGSVVVVSVPGPIDACFQADEKTVNPIQAAVAELIIQILALIVTKGGAILVEYLRGKREMGKPRATKAGVVLKIP